MLKHIFLCSVFYLSCAFVQAKDLVFIFDSFTSELETEVITESLEELLDAIPKDLISNLDIDDYKFSFYKQDGKRYISIVAAEGIEYIVSEDGDYRFIIERDKIGEYENVRCEYNSNGDDFCTISPFMAVMGNSVLKADSLRVQVDEKDDVHILGGLAKNLIIKNENHQTAFNKTFLLSDTEVVIGFGQGQSAKNQFSLPEFERLRNLGQKIELPSSYQDSGLFSLNINTTKFIHTKKDTASGKEVTVFESLGGGVEASLIFSNNDEFLISGGVSLSSGFIYNSDGFNPNNNYHANSNAPFMFNFEVGLNHTQAAILIPAMNLNGEISKLEFKEPPKGDEYRHINIYGGTQMTFHQKQEFDPETGQFKIIGPATYNVLSDKISVQTFGKVKDGYALEKNIEIHGVNGVIIDDVLAGTKKVNAIGDYYLMQTMKGEEKREFSLTDNIHYYQFVDDSKKYQQGYADKANYTNDKHHLDIIGNIEFHSSKYKSYEAMPTSEDGVLIAEQNFARGDRIVVTSKKDEKLTFHDGIEYTDINFIDGSKREFIYGENGVFTKDEKKISFEEDIIVQVDTDINENIVGKVFTPTMDFEENGKSGSLKKLMATISEGKVDGVRVLEYSSQSNDITYFDPKDQKEVNISEMMYGGKEVKDQEKYAFIQINGANINKHMDDPELKEHIEIKNLQLNYKVDERDPENEIKTASGAIDHIISTSNEYAIEVKLKNFNSGNDNKTFEFLFREEKGIKSYAIFDEQGEKVNLSGNDFENSEYDVFTKFIAVFQTDKYERILLEEVSGTFKELKDKNTTVDIYTLQDLDILRQEVSYDSYVLENGELKGLGNRNDTPIHGSDLVLDIETIKATKGVMHIEEVNSEDNKKFRHGDISFGELLSYRLKLGELEDIQMYQIRDAHFLIIDEEKLRQVSGQVGELYYYDDQRIEVIEGKDVIDLVIDDLDSVKQATFNGKHFVRIEDQETDSSYLLFEMGSLELKDEDLSAKLNLNIIEFFEDRLNDKNYLLRADFEGDALYKGHQVRLKVVANDLTTETDKYESEDGAIKRRDFKIIGTSKDSEITELKIELDHKNYKNAFRFKIKGGKSATISTVVNKRKGQYALMGVVEDGEEFEMKLGPIKIKAHEDRNNNQSFSILATAFGSSYFHYLDIINGMVSQVRFNDHFSVSKNGVMGFKSPTLGGFAVELMLHIPEKFSDPDNFKDTPQANSFGLGLSKTTKAGNEHLFLLSLTGDAFWNVQSNNRCTVKFLFHCLGKDAKIPGTFNLSYRLRMLNNDAYQVTIGYDTTTSTLRDKQIDKALAPGLKHGRSGSGGKIVLSRSWFKDKNSVFRLSIGAEDDFSEPMIKFDYELYGNF